MLMKPILHANDPCEGKYLRLIDKCKGLLNTQIKWIFMEILQNTI